MSNNHARQASARVDLYWLPLGVGDNTHCVRTNGRIFESLAALLERRERCDLYHAALEVSVGPDRFVIEMAPVWSVGNADRGVVCEGPVGLSWLGHSRMFRYEVRCWRDGVIPDVNEAVDSPQRLRTDPVQARRLLAMAPSFPNATWGRDELGAGEMWNSNSLISWLLASSGHDLRHLRPPDHGRAPGWSAGLAVAARDRRRSHRSNPGSVDRRPPRSCLTTGNRPRWETKVTLATASADRPRWACDRSGPPVV